MEKVIDERQKLKEFKKNLSESIKYYMEIKKEKLSKYIKVEEIEYNKQE